MEGWESVKARLEQQCNDFNPHGTDIRAALERVEELEGLILDVTRQGFQHALIEAEAERIRRRAK